MFMGQSPEKNIAAAQFDVLADMANIWQNHMFWCFLFLQSHMFDTPNRDSVRQQLHDAGGRFGQWIESFYGREAGRQTREEMRVMTDLYMDYLGALTEDGSRAPQVRKSWNESGNRMAQMLATLNPYWREMEWRALISQEILILSNQAQNYLAGIYDTLGRDFDVYHSIAQEISRYMAAGVIRQFDIGG